MKISIREWQENYKKGLYDSPDVDTQIKAGWFDWFCKDSSLQKRMEKFVPLVLSLVDSKKVDLDKDYIFFKNNCPMSGGTYDSFSICDREDGGDVKYFISYKCPYEKATWAVSKIKGAQVIEATHNWPVEYFDNVHKVKAYFNEC